MYRRGQLRADTFNVVVELKSKKVGDFPARLVAAGRHFLRVHPSLRAQMHRRSIGHPTRTRTRARTLTCLCACRQHTHTHYTRTHTPHCNARSRFLAGLCSLPPAHPHTHTPHTVHTNLSSTPTTRLPSTPNQQAILNVAATAYDTWMDALGTSPPLALIAWLAFRQNNFWALFIPFHTAAIIFVMGRRAWGALDGASVALAVRPHPCSCHSAYGRQGQADGVKQRTRDPLQCSSGAAAQGQAEGTSATSKQKL